MLWHLADYFYCFAVYLLVRYCHYFYMSVSQKYKSWHMAYIVSYNFSYNCRILCYPSVSKIKLWNKIISTELKQWCFKATGGGDKGEKWNHCTAAGSQPGPAGTNTPTCRSLQAVNQAQQVHRLLPADHCRGSTRPCGYTHSYLPVIAGSQLSPAGIHTPTCRSLQAVN